MSTSGKVLLGVFVGAAVGVITGMLIAPTVLCERPPKQEKRD